MTMNICGYIPESINEGPGLRSVVFISGCLHHCTGCFSPHTWSFAAGKPFTSELQHDIIAEMAANPLLQGITIAGGDPFFSADDVAEFIKKIHETLPNFSVWIYSGFTWEQLIQEHTGKYMKLLTQCSVLIDGKFEQKKRDVSLLYRGSSNQRLIDIQQSIHSQRVVEWQATITL